MTVIVRRSQRVGNPQTLSAESYRRGIIGGEFPNCQSWHFGENLAAIPYGIAPLTATEESDNCRTRHFGMNHRLDGFSGDHNWRILKLPEVTLWG
ncbi:hypothetical protein [Laspinema palackyanum]|uniref:hypothetical protein n=1 Tax=Laspinema palackyanum TaxID=3231601 RepID=UPI00349F49A8